MQKHHEHDPIPMTTADEPTGSGRVKQIRQQFLEHSDFGLANRLQEEEFSAHYGRNRTQRRESGLGVQAARVVEEEEKRAFIAKQFSFYQQKQQLEENDVALARRLQDESNIKSEVTDQGNTDIYQQQRSSNDQSYYEIVDQPRSSAPDITNDEQLARILQEEEECLLFASSKRSSKLM